MITEEELAIWQYGQQKKTIAPSWEHLSEHAKLYWRTVASCLLLFLDSKGVRVLDEDQNIPLRPDGEMGNPEIKELGADGRWHTKRLWDMGFARVSRLIRGDK
jgi:hypothetical protein